MDPRLTATAVRDQQAPFQAARVPSRAERAGWLILRRLSWAMPLLVAISLGIFALAWLAPTDAATGFLGSNEEFTSGASRDNVENLIGQQNWAVAWFSWVGSALTGEFGWSTSHRAPVADVVLARLPWTALIMTAGLVVTAVVSIILAFLTALRPKNPVFRSTVAGLWAISAVPSFLVSLGLVALFAIGLGWLPAGGLTDVGADLSVSQVLTHMALPTVAVAVSHLPWMTLHLHEAVSAQLRDPAVVSARGRGMSESWIVFRQVLPGALIPVLAIAGARLTEVVAGAAIVEQIFSWPGLGQSLIEAALAQDFALLATTGILLTAVALAGGLLADLALVTLDPRIDPRGL